jgi:hypothetical protein
MFQQQTLVKVVYDDGDVTLLFADELQAREALGLDEPDGHWRQLDNSLLICGPCARIHDCVLAGGHHFTDWAPCGCGGWRGDHTTHEALRTGVCGHEARICPQCHTTENRRAAALTTPTTHRGGTR